MQDRDFEWDDTKAASNWLDHGITFETARAAFDDALSVDREDTRQSGSLFSVWSITNFYSFPTP